MSKTPEGEVRKWFIKELKKEFGEHLYTQINHQSRYTTRGIPDLTICAEGVTVWVELKAAGGKTTPLQDKKIKEIRSAKGAATVLIGKDVQKLACIVQYIKELSKVRAQ